MIKNYKLAMKLVQLYKWFMIGNNGRKLTLVRLRLYLKIYDFAHTLLGSDAIDDKYIGTLLLTIHKAFELEHKEIFEKYEDRK